MMLIYFTILIVILNVLDQDDHLYSCIMNITKMIKVKY
jgi:hypothetical protein